MKAGLCVFGSFASYFPIIYNELWWGFLVMNVTACLCICYCCNVSIEYISKLLNLSNPISIHIYKWLQNKDDLSNLPYKFKWEPHLIIIWQQVLHQLPSDNQINIFLLNSHYISNCMQQDISNFAKYIINAHAHQIE